jgi:hypothetical protein
LDAVPSNPGSGNKDRLNPPHFGQIRQHNQKEGGQVATSLASRPQGGDHCHHKHTHTSLKKSFLWGHRFSLGLEASDLSKLHPSPRRQSILYAIEEHARGHIAKHIANVDILLDSAVGVAEHRDVIKTITDELDEIAHYQDQLDVIAEHFKAFRG